MAVRESAVDAPGGAPLLELRGMCAAYGKVQVLDGVDLAVGKGEVVALIGSNGAGKSTTLKTISGLMKPFAGEIRFEGERIDGASPKKIVQGGIAQSPEERHIWPAMTVHENLTLGAYLCRSKTEVERRLGVIYHRFPRLKERFRQLAGTLSGGEQQMLAIGRALVSEPKLLLLDEPSLGLSPRMADDVFDFIREIQAHGVTVLLVEQNVYNALSVASRAYVYETGRVVAQGRSEDLLNDDDLIRAYLGG
ncbi:Branched-chain amino acid transport system ATP-binding protein OS=Castellaniella defragrans OX=75697 GN=HNR28_003052 PE=3 SV=1 [Castellaniella defragrans]